MTTQMNLGILILYVSDVQKSRTFYSETVGLPVVEEQSGPKFVMLKPANGGLIGLEDLSIVPAGQAKQPGGIEIGLEVDDVDGLWNTWKAKGVEMLTEPEDFPFGRNFIAKDPDGHYLSVYKFANAN